MVKTILINSSNVSNSLKNQYTYKFVGGGLEFEPNKNHYIAVSSITIPYSFFNISDIYDNRNFSIICNGTTYNLDIPSSFMTVDDLNKFLQFFFIQNNLYTLDTFGNYVYYLELEYNVSRYAVECIFHPLVLPIGGSNPENLVMSGNTLQLVINDSQVNFGKLLGLTPGINPSTPLTVLTSIISNTTVEGSPINVLNLTCSLVNNTISSSPDTFYSFAPSNVSFGSNIVLQPPELIWVDCYPGRFQQLTIEIKDQEGRAIQMRDSSVCIMLCIKSEPIK